MFGGRCIAVVIPAFNVKGLVGQTVRSVPSFVDHVVVVDDGSTDHTAVSLESIPRGNLRLVRHPANRGVGAAITTGYAEALRLDAEVVAVMAGDGQMDPADLQQIIEPVASGTADYVKGNRFLHPDVWRVMPRARLVGNILFSLLTKITSGYWRLFDSQCGYTAISSHALRAIGGQLFERYGYPNDLLARLHSAGARVMDVMVRPVYEGQPSGIRLRTVFYPMLFVLLRSLGRRLWRERGPALPQSRPLRLRSSQDPRTVELAHADRPADHLLPAPPP